jgi:hypothetical protein
MALIYTVVLVPGWSNVVMAQANEIESTDSGSEGRNYLGHRGFIKEKGGEAQPEADKPKPSSSVPPKVPQGAETPGESPKYSPCFYLEPHIGIGGIGPTPRLNIITSDKGSAPGLPAVVTSKIRNPGKMAPATSIGVNVGTWFDYGFIPSLARHLGFCINYNYQPLQFSAASGSFYQTAYHPASFGPTLIDPSLVSGPGLAGFSERFTPMGAIWTILTGDSNFRSSGAVHTLGFIFKVRVGLLPDAKVPFGRLQLWAGVGPSLIIAYQTAIASFDNLRSVNGTPTFAPHLNDYYKFRPASDKALGLQVATGLGWMVLSKVSLDFYAQYDKYTISYNLTTPGHVTGQIDYPINNFSFNLGFAYHL